MPAAKNILALDEALKMAGKRDYTIKLYANADHNGLETEKALLTPDEFRYLQRLVPGVFKDRLNWVLSHVTPRKPSDR